MQIFTASAFSYVYFNFIFIPRNNQRGDLYNGFLFNCDRQFQWPSENALPSFYPNTSQSTGGISFYGYGTLHGPGPSSYPAQDLQEFSSSSPASSESSQKSQSPGPGFKDDSRANSKRWDSAEVKILVGACKTHYNDLKSAKSSRGKKAIWEEIHAEFIQACEEASISTDKSLSQVKEKWRTLFEKYKAVCDNSKTVRGRESFEFYTK